MKLKALFLTFLCSAALAVSIAPGPGFTSWRLAWLPGNPNWNYGFTNYIPQTNSAWIVTGTTNLALTNYTAWPALGVITNWQNTPSNYLIAVFTVPNSGAWFFSLSETNFQGTAPFCIPATTGPLPWPVANTSLLNGQ